MKQLKKDTDTERETEELIYYGFRRRFCYCSNKKLFRYLEPTCNYFKGLNANFLDLSPTCITLTAPTYFLPILFLLIFLLQGAI